MKFELVIQDRQSARPDKPPKPPVPGERGDSLGCSQVHEKRPFLRHALLGDFSATNV
jgi:hypothetical protein